MAVQEYKTFRRRKTVHSNEHIRARITLNPPKGEEAPDISTWKFSAPTRQADDSKLHGRITVDVEARRIKVEVAAGTEPGLTQIDVLTDYGSGNSWFRLGSVFATVKEGSGAA